MIVLNTTQIDAFLEAYNLEAVEVRWFRFLLMHVKSVLVAHSRTNFLKHEYVCFDLQYTPHIDESLKNNDPLEITSLAKLHLLDCACIEAARSLSELQSILPHCWNDFGRHLYEHTSKMDMSCMFALEMYKITALCYTSQGLRNFIQSVINKSSLNSAEYEAPSVSIVVSYK